MKKYQKILFFSAVLMMVALPVLAKPLLGPDGYVPCATDANQVLSLNCFLNLLSGVAKLILGLTGSIALAYFVYGGIRLVISRGNENEITEGKNILSHAIIGVIIILGAYLIVSSIEKIVGFKPTGNFKLNTNTVTDQKTQETKKKEEASQWYCFKSTNTTQIINGKAVILPKIEKVNNDTYSTEQACLNAKCGPCKNDL